MSPRSPATTTGLWPVISGEVDPEDPADEFTEDPRLGIRFEQAFLYASRLHRHQTRKHTRIPYLAHLMGVASLVLEHGADEDTAIAALLHDAAEDQGGRPVLDVIGRRFGTRVERIVADCSDSLETDPARRKRWRERKQDYLDHIAHLRRGSLLVSLADKLYNVQTILETHRAIGGEVWQRFKGKRDGSLWYYRALVEAFRQHPKAPKAIVRQLDAAVTALEQEA